MRVFLYAFAAAALCGAALCVPVRLVLSGAVETGSGRLDLTVRWLLLKTKIRFDLCLFDPPMMTVLIRHGRALTVRPLGGGDRGEKPRFTESLRQTLRVKLLRGGWAVGVRDDPALTALLGGLLEQAGRLVAGVYLPETAEKLETEVHPAFDRDLLRLDVRGIAIAFPAQIMHAWLKSRKKTRSGR